MAVDSIRGVGCPLCFVERDDPLLGNTACVLRVALIVVIQNNDQPGWCPNEI